MQSHQAEPTVGLEDVTGKGHRRSILPADEL